MLCVQGAVEMEGAGGYQQRGKKNASTSSVSKDDQLPDESVLENQKLSKHQRKKVQSDSLSVK